MFDSPKLYRWLIFSPWHSHLPLVFSWFRLAPCHGVMACLCCRPKVMTKALSMLAKGLIVGLDWDIAVWDFQWTFFHRPYDRTCGYILGCFSLPEIGDSWKKSSKMDSSWIFKANKNDALMALPPPRTDVFASLRPLQVQWPVSWKILESMGFLPSNIGGSG